MGTIKVGIFVVQSHWITKDPTVGILKRFLNKISLSHSADAYSTQRETWSLCALISMQRNTRAKFKHWSFSYWAKLYVLTLKSSAIPAYLYRSTYLNLRNEKIDSLGDVTVFLFLLRPRGLVLMEKHTIGLHDEKILLLKRNSWETNNIFFEGKINLKLNPHTYWIHKTDIKTNSF